MFVRAANPIWFFVDLVGQPLNDEYYAFFLTNTLPYLPQNVYRDPQGLTVWTNDVVEFLPNGTLPDNLYFDPSLVYRIEIRHGDSQSDPLIYEINNFVPGIGTAVITSPFPILFAPNLTSNSTFSDVNFYSLSPSGTPSLQITSAGTYSVAPGWDLVLTGVGTTTVTQKIFTGAGVVGQPNSPNYALEFANAGWTTAVLRQRFNNNGAIFGGGAVNMSMLAMAVGGAVTVSMVYSPSNLPGNSTTIVPPTVVGVGTFVTVSGTNNVKTSNNSDNSLTAYVDMLINLPTTGTVDITDVQFVGQNTPINMSLLASVNPAYQQISEERQTDNLFHYFANSLIVLPKLSLLTGWNFSLNPYQFISTALTTVASQCTYVADQTILFSKTASSLKAGEFSSSGQRNGFQLQAVGAGSAVDNRFALIQYIDPQTVAPYWGYTLSALIRMAIFTRFNTEIRMKMRLIYRPDGSLPPTIGASQPIASWANNADPVFAAGWSSIAPQNDPTFFIQPPNSDSSFFAVALNKFKMPALNGTALQVLGVVLYAMDPLDNDNSNPDNIVFDKISLSANDFAIDTPPQTFDDVLRQCQFYYEHSYNIGILPGAITDVGERWAPTVNDAFLLTPNLLKSYPTEFTFPWSTLKRANPTVTLYSPSAGTANRVDSWIYNNGNSVASPTVVNFTGSWTAAVPSMKSFESGEGQNAQVASAAQTPTNKVSTYIVFHYTADARLGV